MINPSMDGLNHMKQVHQVNQLPSEQWKSKQNETPAAQHINYFKGGAANQAHNNENDENQSTFNRMTENIAETFSHLKAGVLETFENMKTEAVHLKEAILPSSTEEVKMDHLPILEKGQDAYDKTALMAQAMFLVEESHVNCHFEPARPHDFDIDNVGVNNNNFNNSVNNSSSWSSSTMDSNVGSRIPFKSDSKDMNDTLFPVDNQIATGQLAPDQFREPLLMNQQPQNFREPVFDPVSMNQQPLRKAPR